MPYVSEFRDPDAAGALVRSIERRASAAAARRDAPIRLPIRLMEVCGTHTVAIFRHGIREVLPPSIRLLSGPGCPVCVTPNDEIDRAIALAGVPNAILTTFGDMVRVPGTRTSLQEARAAGADVRIVYSPLDALRLAQASPAREIIFLAVGFETTIPAVAGAIHEAHRLGVPNFSVFAAHKVVPPALRLLLDSPETRVDGFLLPGHVSAIIGARPYEFIPRDYRVPCVIAGFEPLDVLQSIDMLLAQIIADGPRVEIQYRRTVRPEGNETATRYIAEVFESCDVNWRGLGGLPGSGLRLREEYAALDAARRFPLDLPASREHPGCRCGAVLRGVIDPPECPLFGRACTPERPIGPCMVSTEGTCAAWHQYAGIEPAAG